MTTEAKVVIKAEDRTAQAFRQVTAGLDKLNRSAKATAQVGRLLSSAFLGFGAVAGLGKLLNNAAGSNDAFRKSLDDVRASVKSLLTPQSGLPRVTDAMKELNATLNDPSVRQGADSLLSLLLTGTAKLAEYTAQTVANLTVIGKAVGLVSANTRQDEIDKRIQRIAEIRSEGVGQYEFGRIRQKELDRLEDELYRLQTYEGPRGPGRRGSSIRANNADYSAMFRPKGEAIGATFGRPRTALPFIFPEDLEATRFDEFGDKLLEETEGIAKQMEEIFAQPLEGLTVYADQAARNMQDAFANFLFDPFEDGLKGMLRGFIDVIRRMVAESAAAKIFGSSKSGGFGLGDAIVSGLGSLFGFAQGGSFKVGGSGGTDSQLVAFRASPDERVTVTRPGQAGGMTYAPVYNFSGTSQELLQFRAYVDAKDSATLNRMQQLVRGGAFAG